MPQIQYQSILRQTLPLKKLIRLNRGNVKIVENSLKPSSQHVGTVETNGDFLI